LALVLLLVGRFVTSPLVYLAAGVALGGLAYVASSYLLGGREIPQLIVLVRGKTQGESV